TIAAVSAWEGRGPAPAADRLGLEAPGGSNLAEGLALGKAGLHRLIGRRPGGGPGPLLLREPRGTPRARQGPAGGGGGGAGGRGGESGGRCEPCRTAVPCAGGLLQPRARGGGDLRWAFSAHPTLAAPRARGREARQPTRAPGDDAARGGAAAASGAAPRASSS